MRARSKPGVAAGVVFAALTLSACASAPSPITPATSVPATWLSPSAAAAGSQERAARLRLDVRHTPVGAGTVAWAEVGSGDPLVLLNGTASPMAEWDPAFLTALARNRRVIVMDYAGLGGSTALKGPLTFDRLADGVNDWLHQIGVSRADVLGWSMGTFVTQRLAVRHPDSVRQLVLVGGNPGGDRTTLGPRWVQRADSDPNYTTHTYLRTNYPHTACARAAGRAFLQRQSAAVDSGRFPPDRVPAATYRAMVRAEDPWLRSNVNWRQLAGVTAPSLVLVGARDVITPPPNSRALARALPRSVLRIVSGAGHSLLFQEPRVATDLIEEFLAGAVSPETSPVVPGTCSGR